MLPVASVAEAAMQLLAADAATLAPAANANEVHLVMADFTPSPTLEVANLTFATFTGSTALDQGLGTQPEGIDPSTGDYIITLEAPAGGWRWETGDAVNLPQTIYGFALTTDAAAALLATAKLPSPITLTAPNQVISLGDLTFRMLNGAIT